MMPVNITALETDLAQWASALPADPWLALAQQIWTAWQAGQGVEAEATAMVLLQQTSLAACNQVLYGGPRGRWHPDPRHEIALQLAELTVGVHPL